MNKQKYLCLTENKEGCYRRCGISVSQRIFIFPTMWCEFAHCGWGVCPLPSWCVKWGVGWMLENQDHLEA